MIKLTYFNNLTHTFRPYRQGDPLWEVASIDVEDSDAFNDDGVGFQPEDFAWAHFQRLDEFHAELDKVGAPSMSVGDVVAVSYGEGDVYLVAVDRMGWIRLTQHDVAALRIDKVH